MLGWRPAWEGGSSQGLLPLIMTLESGRSRTQPGLAQAVLLSSIPASGLTLIAARSRHTSCITIKHPICPPLRPPSQPAMSSPKRPGFPFN